ncbi:MAG: hypothetical protein JXL97_08615 [Bacteroidales bacterium]|nr:hypothetical protein [Bacteroidales bacterium]
MSFIPNLQIINIFKRNTEKIKEKVNSAQQQQQETQEVEAKDYYKHIRVSKDDGDKIVRSSKDVGDKDVHFFVNQYNKILEIKDIKLPASVENTILVKYNSDLTKDHPKRVMERLSRNLRQEFGIGEKEVEYDDVKEEKTGTGTKFYDINTGEFIEQIEDGFTQIISIEKSRYEQYKKSYEHIFCPLIVTCKKEENFISYIINASKNDANFHILIGLTTEELDVRAFLATIRYAENTGPGQTEPLGYNAQYTGITFTDLEYDPKNQDAVEAYSKHPNKTLSLPPGWPTPSNAAGAYQFLYSTWKSFPFSNFNPTNQDKGALILIQRQEIGNPRAKGVIEDIKNGNIATAAEKLNGTWTSLPGGNEEGLNENEFLNKFNECLINELKENSIIYSPIGILKL